MKIDGFVKQLLPAPAETPAASTTTATNRKDEIEKAIDTIESFLIFNILTVGHIFSSGKTLLVHVNRRAVAH